MPNTPPNSPDPAKPATGPAQKGAPVTTSQSLVIASRQLFESHVELRTPVGESYLGEGARKVIKDPGEPLQQYLADVDVVTEKRQVTINYYFGLTPKTAWRPMKYVTQCILDDFEKAALEFYRKAHADQKLAQFQRQVRTGFRLPDPDLDPDSYWLVGDRFNPHLIILWGCEKLDENKKPQASLPLVKDAEFFPNNPETVVDKLRQRLLSWEGIVQENLDLIVLKKEVLGRFLARPVYDQPHEQVVGMRLVVAPDAIVPINRFRPLKKLPTAEIKEFEKAANAFYGKAHDDEDSVKDNPDVTPYERELRRGFRLPDVDSAAPGGKALPEGMDGLKGLLEPAAPKGGGKGGKGARKKGPSARVSYWVYGKRFSKKLLIAVEGNEPFEQCLCLTRDESLNLPPGAKDAAPGILPGGDLGMPAETVAEKLRLREDTWIKRGARVAAVVAGVGLLTFLFLRFVYVPLIPVAAAVAKEETLDPNNGRNVIVVTFNTAVSAGSIRPPQQVVPGKLPNFTLQNDKSVVVPIQAATNLPGNAKQIVLYLDPTNAVPDGADYTLKLNDLRPRFGRAMKKDSHLAVVTKDTRNPKVDRAQAAGGNTKKVKVVFTKALGSDAAQADHYAIEGFTFDTPKLRSTNVIVLTSSGKDFMIDHEYKLTVRDVRDAAINQNPIEPNPQSVTFTYKDMPPEFDDDGIVASASQLMIHAIFTEEVEPESATNAANYDFGSGKMSILAIALAPKKDAIDIFLTNSYMVPGPTYTLHFRGVKNTKGNAGEDSKTFRFTGTPDTTRPRLKGIDPNDKGTAVVVSFSKPIQGTATNKDSYTLSQSVNVPGAAWQKSTVDFTVEQAASNAVRLRFSAPLVAQNRYRLSWTNVQDQITNMGVGSSDFVINPVIDVPELHCNFIRDQAKVWGITLIIYSEGKLDDGSFQQANFSITSGPNKKPLAFNTLDNSKSGHKSEGSGDDWRSEVDFRWTTELPNEDIDITWNNVKVEGQPAVSLTGRLTGGAKAK